MVGDGLCGCGCGRATRIAKATALSKGNVKGKPFRYLRGHYHQIKHGHGRAGAATGEFWTWNHMLGRCRNPRNKDYRNYGGRGIRVCERWLTFAVFLADVGLRPSSEHTIERIDVNGHYEPGNVRWATLAEQSRNKRNTRWVTHEGTTLCLSEWAARAGLKTATLLWRLDSGWTVEKALTAPLVPASAPRPRPAMKLAAERPVIRPYARVNDGAPWSQVRRVEIDKQGDGR